MEGHVNGMILASVIIGGINGIVYRISGIHYRLSSDKEGLIVSRSLSYSFGTPPEDILEDIHHILG